MRILIDNIHYEVREGKNLLEACIGLGLDLPYFCYHPALGSVGACRQCAVKKFANSDDKTGRIIMACMEPVTDGMIISVDDPEAKQFRAAIIEGLMTNHPHDCPVCDEGGECHLQDMTVMTGHAYRRFTFKKRTFTNQNLGPFIQHEMNRCIQCYRCVRFYRDYAGGKDLNVFGSANRLYFGRKEDGVLESEFSGNLVEVCPTGVFTDKTFKKHYTRKWDLTQAPSVCVHCSVGCNTIAGERYGTVRRITNRYNGDVNGYFLCDRGRFGYEFIHHPARIKKIMIRTDNTFKEAPDIHDVFPALPGSLKSRRIIGIGSPRASMESNFALLRLVGKDRFFNGMQRSESLLAERALRMLTDGMVHAPSVKEIEQCDAVFVLGEDITQTAPRIALALRQAVRNKPLRIAEDADIPGWNDAAARELAQLEKSPLYIAHPAGTRLDDIAARVYNAAPDDIARLGFAVAAAIDTGAPGVPDSSNEIKELAAAIARDLLNAERPLIVTGISGENDAIMDAVTNMIVALSGKNKKPSVAIAFPECNTAGVATMNVGNLDDALDLIAKEPVDMLIVLENDLFRRIPEEKAETALSKCGQVVVIDQLMHATAKRADVILPAATYAESPGTIVNYEGRAQRYYPVLPPADPVKESWQWISEMMRISGSSDEPLWNRFDDVVNSLADHYPDWSVVKDQLPDAGFRFRDEKIARQTMRFSGRTAITADVSVSEPKPPEDLNTPMNFSMEGYKGRPPAGLIPWYWTPGWNSYQAANKYLEEPNGPVKDGNPGVPMLDGKASSSLSYIKKIPPPFIPASGSIVLVRAYTIFGSEELSSYGQAISEQVPPPFILMNEKESARWKGNVLIRTDNRVPDGIGALFVQNRVNNSIKIEPA